MARISDFMTSSRDTSPDPITLPSSPPASHSPRKARNVARASSPRKARALGTPSKSLVLDTPAAGEASPWRIKVTVEAEPSDGSPIRRTARTTTVPLKTESRQTSVSPAKRSRAKEGEVETRRSGRKRKGTPMKDRRLQRAPPEPALAVEEDDDVPPTLHSPVRRASGRLARLEGISQSTRSKRLSVAREELNYALQSAVGHAMEPLYLEGPGDKTVSMNEDFSIISVDSLQNAKEASMANVMHTIPEVDKSTAKASFVESPPPEAGYPDISNKAEEVRASLGEDWDPMSWRSTGLAKHSTTIQFPHSEDRVMSIEDQWQQEREVVSQQIRNADADRVIVVDDAAHEDDAEDLTDEELQDVDVADLDDIWQDEASRSLGEDQQAARDARSPPSQPAKEPSRSPQLAELFAGESQKPLRSKIPRTWRRSSGMDFSYVDSPAHEPVLAPREERRNSTDGSGVLTPPSTDDEERKAIASQDDELADDVESEFQPDAEATRVQNDIDDNPSRPMSSNGTNGAASPVSESGGSSSSSSDENDAGAFFSRNMPSFFNRNQPPRRRPPRQKTMDLTELLNLDGANSPVKSPAKSSKPNVFGSPKSRVTTQKAGSKRSPLHMRPVLGHIKSTSGENSVSKLISTPLRKSLLRSSKIPDSPLNPDETGGLHMRYPNSLAEREQDRRDLDVTDEQGNGESFASKESDQRQLLREAADQQYRTQDLTQHGEDSRSTNAGEYSSSFLQEKNRSLYGSHDKIQAEQTSGVFKSQEKESEVSRSYEERLNLESPQRVRVNFNDTNGSSLLAHMKEYPPLFGSSIPQQQQPPPQSVTSDTITLVEKKPTGESFAAPGLLSRLSQTFWSAVVHPTAPSSSATPPEHLTTFPADLRTQLRQRYGVASENLPWTMYHMRILHRMLNSLTSHRRDSIIPCSGPLPPALAKIINTQQTSITSYQWLFTRPHAYVVWSFAQILVPQHLVDAMERGEVEWLGDSMAAACRGYYGKDTRHGSRPVWTESVEKTELMHGTIDLVFLVKALGAAVYSNDVLARRKGGAAA